MTDALGKTVEETGDALLTIQSKYNNNKQNMVIFYKKSKKHNKIELTQKNGLEQSKIEISSTLPRNIKYDEMKSKRPLAILQPIVPVVITP